MRDLLDERIRQLMGEIVEAGPRSFDISAPVASPEASSDDGSDGSEMDGSSMFGWLVGIAAVIALVFGGFWFNFGSGDEPVITEPVATTVTAPTPTPTSIEPDLDDPDSSALVTEPPLLVNASQVADAFREATACLLKAEYSFTRAGVALDEDAKVYGVLVGLNSQSAGPSSAELAGPYGADLERCLEPFYEAADSWGSPVVAVVADDPMVINALEGLSVPNVLDGSFPLSVAWPVSASAEVLQTGEWGSFYRDGNWLVNHAGSSLPGSELLVTRGEAIGLNGEEGCRFSSATGGARLLDPSNPPWGAPEDRIGMVFQTSEFASTESCGLKISEAAWITEEQLAELESVGEQAAE